MPVITLPDGSQRAFDNPISVHDVAAYIGPGLANAALGGIVGDRQVHTSFIIEDDVELPIIT
jgi:threonyl-tRNA synthetase